MRVGLVLTVAALAVAGCSSVTTGKGGRASGLAPASTAGSAAATGSGAAVTPPPGTGTATAAPGTGATAPTTAAAPAPKPLRTVTVNADDGTTYLVTVWAEDRITDCAAHSYGKVKQYFTQHPCQGASRHLLTLRLQGRTVAMSAITVGCAAGPTDQTVYEYAAQFQKLEGEDGTGSIDDLLREGARLPGTTAIPAQEAFDVQGQDTAVFVLDAWYLEGTTHPQDPALLHLEENLILTPVTD